MWGRVEHNRFLFTEHLGLQGTCHVILSSPRNAKSEGGSGGQGSGKGVVVKTGLEPKPA